MNRCFHAMQIGAQRAGSYCTNVCVSNTIAGISAATGQDLACIHESSWAMLEIATETEIKVAGK